MVFAKDFPKMIPVTAVAKDVISRRNVAGCVALVLGCLCRSTDGSLCATNALYFDSGSAAHDVPYIQSWLSYPADPTSVCIHVSVTSLSWDEAGDYCHLLGGQLLDRNLSTEENEMLYLGNVSGGSCIMQAWVGNDRQQGDRDLNSCPVWLMREQKAQTASCSRSLPAVCVLGKKMDYQLKRTVPTETAATTFEVPIDNELRRQYERVIASEVQGHDNQRKAA